jgi:hypothetical protein
MPDDWRSQLDRLLPLYGHRNWILVADSAFPAQVGAFEVIATGEDHVTVVHEVIERLKDAPHLRPVIYLDAELDELPEPVVPGLKATRGDIHKIAAGLPCHLVLHEELLERLEEVAQSFRVLVLKTTGTVPYSSVFVELDCGYWSPQQEATLRRAMSGPRD